MLGLKRGTVKLASHHKEWAKLFKKEKRLLLKTFGKKIINIQHIGSTAIFGVPAKPIIDIEISILSLDRLYVLKFVRPLKKLGYSYMHKFPTRHFFAKGPEENRTHHLSLVKASSKKGLKETVLFRDYLKNNAGARKEYIKLKQKLVKKFASDRKSYTLGKEKFIKKILKKT